MKVERRPMLATIVTTSRQQKLNQDRVYVDGKFAGYLPHREGAKFMAVGKWTPDELAEIEKQLQVESVKPPDVPQEFADEVTGTINETATDEDFEA